MKRHPLLNTIIAISVAEIDKLVQLAELNSNNETPSVVLTNDACTMAIHEWRNPKGEIGFRMGKMSDAIVITPEFANELITKHNPGATKTLLLHPSPPARAFANAVERINRSLEDCIAVHNKNALNQKGPATK